LRRDCVVGGDVGGERFEGVGEHVRGAGDLLAARRSKV
jgi:hypothetical protein